MTETKKQRLQMVVALLNDADAMLQGVLGASDECYELHCAIENVAEEVEELIAHLEEENAN
jgi:hypothetical protein